MRNTIKNLIIIFIIIGVLTWCIIQLITSIEDNKNNNNSKISYYEELLTTKEVSITYYGSGEITSLQESPYEGSIAISRDLYQYFHPGEIVYLECDCVLEGYYRINDTTHSRFKNRVDVYTKKKLDLDIGLWIGKINKIEHFIRI